MKLPIRVYTSTELDSMLKSSFTEDERVEIARKVLDVIQSVYRSPNNVYLYNASLALMAILSKKLAVTKAILLFVNPQRCVVTVRALNVFMKRETTELFDFMRKSRVFVDKPRRFNDITELENFVETFVETAKKYAKHIIALQTREKTIYIYIILDYQKL